MEASLALSGQVAGHNNAVKPVVQAIEETVAEFEAAVTEMGRKFGALAALAA